ncbi:MAG: type III-B CRISPR module RAMP protein Cmr6 [Cyanobacteria bacterium RI_101]|nr:type III-B CRISPR module RAMP protein Cmr6 [Cyanobacteria bacterium RI_101]
MPSPTERPKPNKPQPPAPRTIGDQTASKDTRKKKVILTPVSGHGGGSKDGGGRPLGGGGNDSHKPPSCWLDPDNEPSPDKTASFVEYLRWMRPADYQYKDPTKVQILQKAMESAKNYDTRLKRCVARTKKMASLSFEVTAPWRIRVGGHRGPESILLPAFDSLGMPYIPSASLRGVARAQAIREVMENTGKSWQKAVTDPLIVKHFGSLDADQKDQAGKVVFFDAYPTSGQCLTMDMANNIWSWKDDVPDYSPNPNPFLSLKEPTFVIGLGLITGCQDQNLLNQVKQWLVAGLANGAGSQVNTGYGQLLENRQKPLIQPFLEVEFALEGQLIHSYQKAGRWNEQKNRFDNGINQAEVRPTAFKSMLRYWFRVFALGVLSANDAQTWEGKIFGAINPTPSLGFLTIRILEGRILQKEAKDKKDKVGEMTGVMTLSFSSEAPQNREDLQTLLKNLTWLMFNLGGIGQGARRPCYSRQSRPYAPWWRGSSLYVESDPDPWGDSEDLTAQEFARLFKRRLREFYGALGIISGRSILHHQLRNVGAVNESNWHDVADQNCRIIITSGQERFSKPYALAQLHSDQFKLERRGERNYNGNLCGQVHGKVKPSPVWISHQEDFQIVTIFGAVASPRKDYLDSLQNKIQVFPLP